MKRVIGLIVMLVGLAACQTTINNENTNNNENNNQGNPTGVTPVPGLGVCLPSEEVPVRVDLTLPSAPIVGGNATTNGIDATPKSAQGKRSDTCNELQKIFWTTNPTATCIVPNPEQFTTNLECKAAGPCQLTATIPTKGVSGSGTVTCR